MKQFTPFITATAVVLSATALYSNAENKNPLNHDLWKLRYKVDTQSVSHNRAAINTQNLTNLVAGVTTPDKAAEVKNPTPVFSTTPSNDIGDLDGPNGEIWHYTGDLVYLEIPPHDNVMFTDRILQEYTFTIYNPEMKVVGIIKDKMDYQEDEERTVTCEVTPVITRNFFNTDDDIEIMIALGVNRIGGGNNYRTLVYPLNGEKNDEGYNKPIATYPDFVADVVEGPSTDGSDNFFITFMEDVFDADNNSEELGFWDTLLAQKVEMTVYGKALDDKGPRKIYNTTLPLIQFPGDQQDVPAMMSMRHGDDVVFCFSQYAEPFYNRYDNPLSEDMTMREGNSLVIKLYKATEKSFDLFSTTTIPISLDPMPDASGNPTCLFSYYSVGNLRYTGDILFDLPGVEADKPDFIITRGNYQISTDDTINSYFTYKNDGTLKNTIFLYSEGTREMGNLDGFEPQQLFVSQDSYGYLYNFVDLYSAKTVSQIEADYYYDDDSDTELLTSNVARTPSGDSYQYVFELRYPMVDDDENDILRFMYINKDGSFDHMENVNMGKGVAYAQSFLSTDALAPHAYALADSPVFMMLVKRGLAGSSIIEELMVAEAMSEENPSGKTLLQLGPNDNGALASIVPEFANGDESGSLWIYYYDSDKRLYTLDVYALPLDKDSGAGAEGVVADQPTFYVNGTAIEAEGEIRIFTTDGKLVASGNGSVEFASLESGIYILNVNGKAYKVIK